MQHESFKSPEVAKVLNSSFIPIKLDREARPDLDEIYMSYVTATTGSGGWPLNVFLTPDLDPVFGGTYWPGPGSTSLNGGRKGSIAAESPLSFLDILGKMLEIWSNQQDRCLLSARDAAQQLRSFAAEGMYSDTQTKAPSDTPEPLDLDLLDDALSHFRSRYDSVHAGFSPPSPSGPKFPTAPNLAFLLRIGASITTTSTRFGFPSPVPPILGKKACTQAASMALQTLVTISRGGLRDHLGRGFHRYSVTPDWNLPHFEKMLPDNALLMSCYCDAWALSKDPEILGTIYSLMEYFTNPDSPIVNHEGGWYSSEDADSRPSNTNSTAEAREGAYYLWTFKEFETVLGDDDALVLARHFGVMANGNVPAEHDAHDEFLTQNVLHVTVTPSVLAKEFGMSESDIITIIKSGKAKLAAHRAASRSQPGVDVKIVTAYNALAISALGRAANTLAEIDASRSERCKEAALKAGAFLQQHNYDTTSPGKLLRYALVPNNPNNDGDKNPPITDNSAFIDDYAYLTSAYLTLYDLTFSLAYLTSASHLQNHLSAHFLSASSGGYFQAPLSSSEHIVRLKPGTDTALPSPNGAVAMNLLYLASYVSALEPEDVETPRAYVAQAKKTIDAFAVEMIQHPFLFVGLLGAVVFDAVGMRSLVVQGSVPERDVRALNGWGRTVVKIDAEGEEKKTLVCENGACREYVEGELDKDPEYEDEEDEGAEGTLDGGKGKGAAEAQNVVLLREKARLEQERAEAESRKAVLESEKREIEEAQGVVERTISQ